MTGGEFLKNVWKILENMGKKIHLFSKNRQNCLKKVLNKE